MELKSVIELPKTVGKIHGGIVINETGSHALFCAELEEEQQSFDCPDKYLRKESWGEQMIDSFSPDVYLVGLYLIRYK
jgi:hypothetical protein